MQHPEPATRRIRTRPLDVPRPRARNRQLRLRRRTGLAISSPERGQSHLNSSPSGRALPDAAAAPTPADSLSCSLFERGCSEAARPRRTLRQVGQGEIPEHQFSIGTSFKLLDLEMQSDCSSRPCRGLRLRFSTPTARRNGALALGFGGRRERRSQRAPTSTDVSHRPACALCASDCLGKPGAACQD